MCGPSSGCDLTYRAAIQDVWGVFEGVSDWVGVGVKMDEEGVEGEEEGKRSRCFNSGYHDLGLLKVYYH